MSPAKVEQPVVGGAFVRALGFHARNEAGLERKAIVASLEALLAFPAFIGATIDELVKIEAWDALESVWAAYEAHHETAPWVTGSALRYLEANPTDEATRMHDRLLEVVASAVVVGHVHAGRPGEHLDGLISVHQRPRQIRHLRAHEPKHLATVDGDLSDWGGAVWVSAVFGRPFHETALEGYDVRPTKWGVVEISSAVVRLEKGVLVKRISSPRG